MLLELEKECLEVYRRKVDLANRSRAQLRQAIADAEAELAAICSATGERPVHIRQSVQNTGSLKEELSRNSSTIGGDAEKEICEKKSIPRSPRADTEDLNEIYGSTEYISSKLVVDESDLSLRKLEELHRELHELRKEKSYRLRQVQEHVCALNSPCSVLGVDSKKILTEVHPSLRDSERSKNISNGTIEQLAAAIQKLREVKLQRMQRLQDLATTMLELWNLMDIPMEEQQMFQNVTCNIAASEHEITEPNSLSMDFINHVEAEVSRLEEFKSSKMKELVLKKRSELEEFCRKTHMVPEVDSTMEDVIDAIESELEEVISRKELLERDENRYNAGRGAHLTLKRAEKACSLVKKLPAIVDALDSKTGMGEGKRH